MYHKILKNPSFHAILVEIDINLAKQIQQKGCIFCGGVLHKANYPRSPLGLSACCRKYYKNRNSFCCKTCRKRTTATSVRFFGQKRFPAHIIILLSLLKCGVTARSIAKVKRFFNINISKRTWSRWCRWWRECFSNTKFWQQKKGIFPIKYLNETKPRSLIKIYQNIKFQEKLVKVLEFLAPLTAGIYRAV